MAWEENSCICLNMQLIAILSRIGVLFTNLFITFCIFALFQFVNKLLIQSYSTIMHRVSC